MMESQNTLKQVVTRNNSKNRASRSIKNMRKRMFFTKNTPRNFDTKQGLLRNRSDADTLNSQIDVTWYEAWVAGQLRNLPYGIRDLRIENEKLLMTPSFDVISKLLKKIGDYTRKHEGVSIDEIVGHLQITGILDTAEASLAHQKLLIFAVLGWGSMLYQPAFNVCSIEELSIHQDPNLPQSDLIFDTYRVSADLCDRPLSVILKAFGNLLPAGFSGVAQVASENSKLVSSWLPIYPTETNAYLLHSLVRVEIRWVDALALHLDYDKSTRSLSLFRYPSFCLEMLRSDGIIYSFGSIEHLGIDPRADKHDITHLLQEVLLSYRLLFAQSAQSRKLFRRTFAPTEPCHQVDTLLPLVCTKKELPYISDDFPMDRQVYFAARDFKILYERVELIANELKGAKPRSIPDLIRDKRDTLQYWTFWLVSIIGGLSIILSLIQVILQAVQLIQS